MNRAIVKLVAAAICAIAVGCAAEDSKHAPNSADPKRPLGLEPGWELAPKGNFSAKQKGWTVTLTATGENPTAGYEMKLVQSPLKIWPPQFLLAQKKPDGPVAQVISPFEAEVSFTSEEPVEWVRATDARGPVNVPVTRNE